MSSAIYDGLGFGANMAELYRQGYGAVQFGMRLGAAEQLLADSKVIKTMSQSRQVFNSSVTAFKTAGRNVAFLGAAVSVVHFATSDHSGADWARLGSTAIITGTAFIPVVGPFISIGLGIADSMGAFDSLYNKFD